MLKLLGQRLWRKFKFQHINLCVWLSNIYYHFVYEKIKRLPSRNVSLLERPIGGFG
jgi:hypothetical protein